MLFYGKIGKAILFVHLEEQTTCPLVTFPTPMHKKPASQETLKMPMSLHRGCVTTSDVAFNETYAGLFNSQHVQTGTSNLAICRLTVHHQFWMSSVPTKAEKAAPLGESLACSSPMISPNPRGIWKHLPVGRTAAEMQTGLLGRWVGCPGRDSTRDWTATKHHLLWFSSSQHIHLPGQLSSNAPFGSDIRWLSFVWPYLVSCMLLGSHGGRQLRNM